MNCEAVGLKKEKNYLCEIACLCIRLRDVYWLVGFLSRCDDGSQVNLERQREGTMRYPTCVGQ